MFDIGSFDLTIAIYAVGSGNKLRVTVTNFDASYAFKGGIWIMMNLTNTTPVNVFATMTV